ncbi:MAG: ABC transporter ATP-binding protein [bacterium]|nr:ABC transporter ATP-binding protein [bacterium]
MSGEGRPVEQAPAGAAPAELGDGVPKMRVFLWRYFRRYVPQATLAVVATAIFAVSTVTLLALFRPILSDVLQADREDLEGPAAVLLEQEDEEDSEPGRFEEAFGFHVDLDEVFETQLTRLEVALGVDSENNVWFLPVLFMVVFMMRSLAAFANGYLFQILGLGATNDLRNDLYERILNQSSSFYSDHPSGELISRVGNDISVMQNAVTNRLLDLFQQSVTLVLLIWYLLSTHFRLALICLVLVPVVAYPIVRFGKGMRKTSHRSQERLAELSNLVAEAVRGHRVVKAFGMEGFELARFCEATARHLKVKLKAQLLTYASSPVVETLAAAGATAFLVYAGHTVRTGELTPAQVVQFLTNLLMLYDPVRKLNKVNLILQEALAAAHRVESIMHLPNPIEDAPDAVELAPVREEIAFEKVSFAYDSTAVLQGIDLAIRHGEVVALVGVSGAGKSTLVNLLPRYFDPTEGQVSIDGTDLRGVTLRSLRAQIGIVTQDTVLFNDTIRNNIAYGRSDLPLEQVRAAARAGYADEFIETAPEGYDAVIGESGLKLSGGQRQRLAIARALLKDPPILILDEATSHLDSESEALVQKALQNLMAGRTALVIAHRLSTVQRADRILVMESGRVIEEGNHEQLLEAGGVYRRLYDLQFRDGES